MAQATKTQAAPAKGKDKGDKVEVTKIPEFQKDGKLLMVNEERKNKKGELRTRERPIALSGGDFPGSREGKLAFCDYQIARWTWRKELVSKRSDPTQKKRDEIERLRRKLADMEKSLSADNVKDARK